jgi:hypothetical protein
MNFNLSRQYQKGLGIGGTFKGPLYQKGYGLGGTFKCSSNQKGFGLGGFFKNLFSWASPHLNKLKDYFLPIIKEKAQDVAKEVINSTAEIANNVLKGRDLKESANEKITNVIDNLTKQKGSGINRKKFYKKSSLLNLNKKRKRDIFD